ncbi:MAG: 2-oxoacid:acceptor oxidoreductase family protein [Chloroflexi bacterium]|nr:2-oxoacid:acceptor oxidoreductase family protein [Chloroflexota bacterium]
MSKLVEVRWHGRGGQGAVTAGKVLAEAALDAGLYFQAFPEYGPERMGAPIQAFTRISDHPVDLHCQIQEPDVVVVLDPTLLGTVKVTEGLKPDGILLVNTSASPAEIREQLNLRTGRVFTVDASRIAIETLGREITNTPMLGALVKATGLFEVDAIVEQTRQRFAKKHMKADIVEANVAAIRRAAEEVKEG